MYISHRHKIIFVRVPKTACSSITHFLINNIKDPEAIHSGVDDVRIKCTLPKTLQPPGKKAATSNKFVHYSIEDIINDGFIQESQLSHYRIFAVIRDPIDRQKSMYYFRKKWGKNKLSPPSLKDYKDITEDNCAMLESPLTGVQQTNFLTYAGKIRGQFWLYENIEAELNSLIASIGLPVVFPLPRHKANKNKKVEFEFDDEVLNSLRKHYNNDFELYNKIKV